MQHCYIIAYEYIALLPRMPITHSSIMQQLLKDIANALLIVVDLHKSWVETSLLL